MKKIISTIFYVLAIILILIYVWSEIIPHLMLTEKGRLIFLCGSCLFSYIGELIKLKIEINVKENVYLADTTI